MDEMDRRIKNFSGYVLIMLVSAQLYLIFESPYYQEVEKILFQNSTSSFSAFITYISLLIGLWTILFLLVNLIGYLCIEPSELRKQEIEEKEMIELKYRKKRAEMREERRRERYKRRLLKWKQKLSQKK